MRTRIYIDGRPAWSDNVPSSTGSIRFGGTLAFAGPSPAELARQATARSRANEQARRRRAAKKVPA